MTSHSDQDELLLGIFDTMSRVALVGASAKPERPAYQIMQYLLDEGIDVAPVNPGLAGQEILGCPVYASLKDIEGGFDLVNIFRASDAVPGIVREAIELMSERGIEVIWMQQDIVNDDAVKEAEAAGLIAIQDRCIMRDMKRLAS